MGLFTETNAFSISKALIEKAQEGCNTTLYEGDERRIFIESVVTPIMVSLHNVIDDVAMQKMRQYARGEILDAIGGDKCPRLEAKPAIATFRFSRNEPAIADILIPAGTRISSNDEHYFRTTEDCTIPIGYQEVDVMGIAVEGGEAYNNMLPGTVCVIVDPVNGIDGCKNIDMTHDGDDGEPYDTVGDDRYRERIGLYEDSVSTCGSENGYKFFAMTADSTIADVNVVTSEEVEGPEEYDVLIYIVCTGGQQPDEDIINEVYEKCNAKDARPMCEKILVKAAEQVSYDIECKYYVTEADEKAAVNSIEGTGGVIEKFTASQDTQIAKPINPDALFSEIMSAVDGAGNRLNISRCTVIQPEYQELEYNQVAHFSGNLKISHEVID